MLFFLLRLLESEIGGTSILYHLCTIFFTLPLRLFSYKITQVPKKFHEKNELDVKKWNEVKNRWKI